jgi:hypothetical protein
MPSLVRPAAVVLAVLASAIVCAPAGQAQAPAAGAPLRLAATQSETGWIALTVTGAPDGAVDISERAGGRDRVVARMALSGGTGTVAHAVAWRCDRRERHLTATRIVADGSQPATATITTPSCAKRLGLIVAAARLRPGQSAQVRVADTWGQGAISGRVCARSGVVAATCRTVRLRRGQTHLRTGLRLARAGHWTVTLRSAATKAAVQRRVEVGPKTRYRVLVTGDSMVFGIIDVLARSVRRTGGTLTGDPNPGTGITKPSLLNWPAHAVATARSVRPDATVVFLGAAVDTFPLQLGSGATADCCGPDWIGEYTRQVRAMMASYLDGGSSVVYWVLLPAPRAADRVDSNHAINTAIRRAAATFPEGIKLVDIGPAISPGDHYRLTAIYRGRRAVIREPDGIHLANAGVHIATDVILRAMRRDGVATALG